MISVWADRVRTGILDRYESRGTAFLYDRNIDPGRAISLTMPVRTASWNMPLGVAPIFEMNLPEGALRERLRLAFAKATGTFDDIDLLAIVGRSQLGRVRYTGADEQLDESVPFQSVDEILANRRGGELYRYLIERFAAYSGISGVQPKFLVRDEKKLSLPVDKRALASTFRGATHIVKFSDDVSSHISRQTSSFASRLLRSVVSPCRRIACLKTEALSSSSASTCDLTGRIADLKISVF